MTDNIIFSVLAAAFIVNFTKKKNLPLVFISFFCVCVCVLKLVLHVSVRTGLEAIMETYAFWRPPVRTLTFEDFTNMQKQQGM